MLSKNQKKVINAMSQKKQRDKHNLFLAEGDKLIYDLLKSGFKPHLLITTEGWVCQLNIEPQNHTVVTKQELSNISKLKNPQNAIALFPQKRVNKNSCFIKQNSLLLLDSIQDPGNLGTIIRVADWFGINNIVCSEDTADIYNPKVIQATMGAIATVEILYTNLSQFIINYKKERDNPVYGTFLNGENIYETNINIKGAIVIGNEGNGISNQVEKLITDRITIPTACNHQPTAESLNAATATAVVCSELNRRKYFNYSK
ncbi:RNA methyltransferase [Marinilabiliaceae bacterium ANBcel2]|nr:RNA methyltransferase [Marinilabiliaceae bacterium ANBcel2]